MNKFIPLAVPNFVGNEQKYVNDAIKSEWVSTGGKLIDKLEKNIAEYTHCNFAVACQSGTAGLHLALMEVGVKQGVHVIVPTLTFIAAVNPIMYCGAQPIFMDCDDFLCLDVKKLEVFFEEECEKENGKTFYKKTGLPIIALVAVHVFGNMCNMSKIMALSIKYSFKVIEDATEALGTYSTQGEIEGKYAGTIGDIGVFSFNGNKIITTGGGGMVVTNNSRYAEHIKYLSQQAKNDSLHFVHNEIGYNYRLTNLQAALGIAQMEMLEEFVKIKNENYFYYVKKGICLLPFDQEIRSNRWFYSYMTGGINERENLIDKLTQNNIQSRPIWTLIHELPMYCGFAAYKIEKAKYYQDRVVNLPCSTNLTFSDIDYISSVIK